MTGVSTIQLHRLLPTIVIQQAEEDDVVAALYSSTNVELLASSVFVVRASVRVMYAGKLEFSSGSKISARQK